MSAVQLQQPHTCSLKDVYVSDILHLTPAGCSCTGKGSTMLTAICQSQNVIRSQCCLLDFVYSECLCVVAANVHAADAEALPRINEVGESDAANELRPAAGDASLASKKELHEQTPGDIVDEPSSREDRLGNQTGSPQQQVDAATQEAEVSVRNKNLLVNESSSPSDSSSANASKSISSANSGSNSQSQSSNSSSRSNHSSSQDAGKAPALPHEATAHQSSMSPAAVSAVNAASEMEDAAPGLPDGPICDVNELKKGHRQVRNGKTRVGRMEVS